MTFLPPRTYANFKKKTYRSQHIMEFTRQQACSIPRCRTSPCDPHHVKDKNSGMAIKPPDTDVVPLCRIHHQEVDALGKESFCEKYGLTWELMLFRNMSLYLMTINRTDDMYRMLNNLLRREIEQAVPME